MISSIKKFFSSILYKHQDRKVKKIVKKGEKPEVLSWGLIVPHTSIKQGATAFDGKESEYIYWRVAYHWLQTKWQRLPQEYRDRIGLKGAYKNLAMKNCSASAEFHYNAFNGKAKGFECLVIEGDELSAKYGRLLRDVFISHFPERTIRQRDGIKWVKAGQRGFKNLMCAKEAGIKIAILPELFFGDNESDYIQHEKAADIINEFIEKSHSL